MSPRFRISSALKSSLRNISPRRGSYASVISAGIVGRTPENRPKLDSSPQTATTIRGLTPNCLGDALKQSTVFRIHLLRGAHGVAGEAAPEVDLEVERELRLRSIALQDLLDRQDAGQRPIEDLGPDSAAGRFAAERQQPVIEGQRRRRDGCSWREFLRYG